jgi:hypothetical protein
VPDEGAAALRTLCLAAGVVTRLDLHFLEQKTVSDSTAELDSAILLMDSTPESKSGSRSCNLAKALANLAESQFKRTQSIHEIKN